ncbi:MAG: protein BatD, partial [Gemmatimonadaceae bacterium]|nr:protein BatD [Chitinophagaceae bacterium]
MYRKILILIFAGLLPGWLSAQLSFSTLLNEASVGKDDYVQVSFVIANAKTISGFVAPNFKGFSVVSGPNLQSGMSIVNGVLTKYEGKSYVLKPNAPGRITIQGATAVIDGKKTQSNNVVVTVSDQPSGQPQGNLNPLFGQRDPVDDDEVNEEYFLKPGESIPLKIRENLIVKLDVSKTTCYEGEPIVATYKLCSRLKSESKVTKRPSLGGFSVYDMLQPDTYQPSVEKINGKFFNVHVIRKVQLYPIQAGTYELDAVELENTVRFVKLEIEPGNRSGMEQLLQEYMNGMVEGKPEEHVITLSSKPVTIKVLPLPEEGRPADFDGAVGSFSFKSSLLRQSVTPNETATMQVELNGEGNLPLINEPSVKWPSGLEGFQSRVTENTDKTVSPIRGLKLFSFPLTAAKTGLYTLPSVSFSYFDPKAKAYKSLKTDSLTLIVKPGVANKPNILKALTGKREDGGFNWSILFWLLPVLAVAALGIVFVKKKPVVAR